MLFINDRSISDQSTADADSSNTLQNYNTINTYVNGMSRACLLDRKGGEGGISSNLCLENNLLMIGIAVQKFV
jgi:hypothetical protein